MHKEPVNRCLEGFRQRVVGLHDKKAITLAFEDLATHWLNMLSRLKPKSFERRVVAIRSLSPHFRNIVRTHWQDNRRTMRCLLARDKSRPTPSTPERFG